jgi:hypothetical protein
MASATKRAPSCTGSILRQIVELTSLTMAAGACQIPWTSRARVLAGEKGKNGWMPQSFGGSPVGSRMSSRDVI